MSSPPSEPLSPQAAAKHHILVMIVAIVILNAIAIPIYYLLHLKQQPGTRQNTYVGIWMFLSAIIVAVQNRKIRKAQRAAIRGSGTKGQGSGN